MSPKGSLAHLSGHLCRSDRGVEIPGQVPADDTPAHREREAHEGEETNYNHNGPERKGGSRVLGEGNRVHPGENCPERNWEDQGGGDNGSHPVTAAHLLEQAGRNEPADETGEGINDQYSREDRPALGGAHKADQGKGEEHKGGNAEVRAGSEDGAEDGLVLREPEDIAVDELPPGFVGVIEARLRIAGQVVLEIVAQNTNENDSHEGSQEKDENDRVHDGEPLRGGLG